MKYIMFETVNGQKLPVIFPDALTHSVVAAFMGKGAITTCLKSPADPISAGFAHISGVIVEGMSESMGGLASNPTDAARILIGDSVAFMPDGMVALVAAKLKEQSDD